MSNLIQRNMLLGILAHQLDFIDQEQLLRAVAFWSNDKDRSLASILVDHSATSDPTRELLEALVGQHLKAHEEDPEQSLAALSSLKGLREGLASLGDQQINETLPFVASGVAAADVDIPASAGPGRFRVVRLHARGGLGEVSIAQDVELNREVALKEIQTRFASDPGSRSRFVVEAEITGGLEHPGIVPVYGLGQYADGRPYYAMRFIRGQSLQDAADEFHAGSEESTRYDRYYSLEFRKLLRRFVDVCEAMAYAHNRGVLHRDLKPGNIMLGKYGETLIVDWGLAKVMGEDSPTPAEFEEPVLQPRSGSGSAPTEMGSAIGTPAFMSPEQAAGRVSELGPTSDVYSLGATLYYLLVGRLPYERQEIAKLLRKVQTGEFPSPRSLMPSIPKQLEAICMRAMALEQAERYDSPHALAEDIELYLADEPVAAIRDPFFVRMRRWIRKHQTLAASTAVSIVVAIVSLGAFSIVLGSKNRELAAANDSERTAREKAELAQFQTSQQAAGLAFNRAIELGDQGENDGAIHWVARALEIVTTSRSRLSGVDA